MSPLATLALAVLLGWAGLSLLGYALERLRVGRLARAPDVTSLLSAARGLPREGHAIAEPVARAIEAHRPLEPALLEALRSAAAARFDAPPMLAAIREILLVGVAVAPFVTQALTAPGEVLSAMVRFAELPLAVALTEAEAAIAEPLGRLAQGHVEGGAAIAALVLVWVIRDWLLAPTVREARLVEALLKAALRIEPQAPAIVAGRVAEALSPDRGPERPVLASLAWVSAITLGWAALYDAADLRESRERPSSLVLWPPGRDHPVELPPEVRLPRARGGRPVEGAPPTLVIGPTEVRLGPAALAELPKGALPSGWRATAKARLASVEQMTSADRVLVAADAGVSAGLVADVLALLLEHTDLRRFDLLFARPPTGARQATLPMRLGEGPSDALRLEVDAAGAHLAGAAAEPQSLRKAVRERVARQGRPPIVSVMAADEVPWGDILAVLGRADDACADLDANDLGSRGTGQGGPRNRSSDGSTREPLDEEAPASDASGRAPPCGLPGLGLEVRLAGALSDLR